MELITVISTIMLSILSVGGVFINNVLTKIIVRESQNVAQADVRVNSVPTHQLIKGKSDRILVNLQQWEIQPNIRVELFQLETDKINLDLGELRGLSQQKNRDWNSLRQTLNQPLNLGWRVIFREEDLNNLFVSSPAQSIITRIGEDNSQIEILDLNLDLQAENRFVMEGKIKLKLRGEEELQVRLEFDLDLTKGHQFKINNITGTLNDRQLSSTLLQGFADNINSKLTLKLLEESGITLRLLQFESGENQIALAGFMHIQPQ